MGSHGMLRLFGKTFSTGSASNNKEENPPPPPPPPQEQEVNHHHHVLEHEHYVPLRSVTRIICDSLPMHLNISDDAKEMIQACVSEYIRHVTYEANRKCHSEYRLKITAEDVIDANAKLGFNEYVEPLSNWLNGMRAQELRDASLMTRKRNVRAHDVDPSSCTTHGTRARNNEIDDGSSLRNTREK